MEKIKITHQAQIDSADITLGGYKTNSVRLVIDKQETGFTTTAYSFSMTDDMKLYSTERIALLMLVARGVSNEQIKSLIEQRKNGTDVLSSLNTMNK